MLTKATGPLVIALTGPPGAGKTTIARALTRRIVGGRFIATDDFQTVTTMSVEAIDAWFESGGDCNDFALTGLEDELERARRSDACVIVLETPFGRFHRGTARFIDRVIWIDTPLDIALARKMHLFIETALQLRQRPDGVLRWLESYTDAYLRTVGKMCRRQGADHKAAADLVIDGTDGPEANVEAILTFIATLGKAAFVQARSE